MNPLAWFRSSPAGQSGEALAFIRAVSTEAMLPYCTLAIPARGGLAVTTLNPSDAPVWLTKHAAKRAYLLTARTAGPLQGRAISESDLIDTRVVGVSIPAASGRALDTFRPTPAIVVEIPRGLAAMWRLHNPCQPSKARALAAQIAERLGGEALAHMFPVPGCGGVAIRKHLKGASSWTLPSEIDAALGNGAAKETAASESLFVSAETVAIEATDWLWPNVIACGDLTLLGGAPGMGKSQVAIHAAATVSRGGTWPDGSAARRGSVILCETEDRPGSALRPRLETAGAAGISINASPTITVTGVSDPRQAADLVDRNMMGVWGNVIRDLQGAVR